MIRELKNVADKYRDKVVHTGEVNITLMCEEVAKRLEELSQPKTDWIPCEERLPNTLGVYQTVRKVMEGDIVYYLEGASYFEGQNTWHNDIGVNHGREHPNVIAWQPIQPYKKEGAE